MTAIQGDKEVDKSKVVYGMGLGEVVGSDKTEDRVDDQGGVTRTTSANNRVRMLRCGTCCILPTPSFRYFLLQTKSSRSELLG